MDGCLTQITHKKYPIFDEDRDAAIKKAIGFLGEKCYSAADRNCQHFVNEMLMDERISMDIERSEKMRLIACIIDSLSQMAGRFLHMVVRYLQKMCLWILKQLKACCSTGFLKTLFEAIGDDTAEYLCKTCKLLACPELSPLQRVLKDGAFAFLIEFIVFTIQTCVELYRLYKGEKRARDIAPVLIKRFIAMFGAAAGAMAGSAIATMLLGLAPYTSLFLVCQVVAALVGHALSYYFGSWLCGGILEMLVTEFLDWLKESILPDIFEFPKYVLKAAKFVYECAAEFFNDIVESVKEVAGALCKEVSAVAHELKAVAARKTQEILDTVTVKAHRVVNSVSSAVSQAVSVFLSFFSWW